MEFYLNENLCRQNITTISKNDPVIKRPKLKNKQASFERTQVFTGKRSKERLFYINFKTFGAMSAATVASDQLIGSTQWDSSLLASILLVLGFPRKLVRVFAQYRAPAVSFDRKHSVFSTTLLHWIMRFYSIYRVRSSGSQSDQSLYGYGVLAMWIWCQKTIH